MIGKTYGNYRIEQQIGEGGMGVLYLATDLSTRRQVAMKFIRPYLASDPQFQQRFIQEARAIVALDHPNIIRVLHFSSGQGPLFIVMEYINGGSLRDYQKWLFRQQRAIEINDAIRITQQIADALHYAHRVNMVHRDVKPDNVLLRLGSNNTIQQAVLTDFGLAGLAATVSTTGAPKGTFAYMSPEQCQGERVDGRSDIYSLGIMLYELVVGRLPFQPANLNDAIRMHASAPVPPPSQFRPNIPQVLEQIILKALAKSPNERFQNASAMAQALLGASSPGAQAQPAQPAAPVGVRTEYGSPPAIAPAPQMDNPPVAPGDAGKLRLVYGRSGQAANFAWLDRDVLMIGREQGNNIMLEGAQISRNHARIDRGNDGRVRITDLGSSNGTYLGNMRLNPNTPYEWRPGQMARIGEFWVKLETAVATQPPPGQPAQAGQAAMGAPGLVLPAAGPQPLNSAVYSVVPPAAAASNTPQATTARINAKLLSDIISVQAGGRTIITVEVFNQGSVVDHFSAEVRGLPQDWYTLPPEAVQLLPSQRNNLLISLHPPRHSRSTAGVHPYDILIRSRNAPNEYVTRPGKLQIEPFYGLETAVYPKRLRQLGAFDVSVTNSGNTQENYSVNASDPEQSLEMVVDRPQVQVPPGQTEKVLVRVRPRMRPLVGTSKTIPVSMAIKSLRAEGEQQSQTAEFVNGPLLPTWLISGASLLFTLCIMLGIFGVIAKRASDLASLETGNTSATQAVIASQTALAAADDDLDGLTNQKEGQLGTDPQNSDTDGDGLGDGDEVNVQNTNPRNRDTDGDTLSDGEEVNRGLSPTNRDSDGDGVPDGADTAPGATSTPIPSITPTLPPTPSVPPPPTATTAPTLTPIPSATPTLSPTPTFTFTPTPTPAPRISIQPAAIPTLTDIVGDNLEGPGQTFIINNSGGSPLIVTMVTTDNPDFQVIVPSGLTFPATIAANGSSATLIPPQNFQVVLKTNQLGTIRGSLIIQSNDPAAPSLVVPLVGNGATANADISILEASPLNFSDSNAEDANDGSTQDVTIHNAGPVDVTLVTTFSPASQSEFRIVSTPTTNLLLAGNDAQFTIAFRAAAGTPVNVNPRNVTFIVAGTFGTTTVDTATIALVGTITPPAMNFTLNTNPWSFPILTSTTTNDNIVNVTNLGSVNITLNSGSFNNGKFSIVGGLPVIIAPGAAGQITVRFNPGGAFSTESPTLTVNTTLASLPTGTFPFTATALAPHIANGPFNDQLFSGTNCGSFDTINVSIQNNGNMPLTVTASFTLNTLSSFFLFDTVNSAVTQSPLTVTINPGPAVDIPVRYQPVLEPPLPAAIEFAHNDPIFPERPIIINFIGDGDDVTCPP